MEFEDCGENPLDNYDPDAPLKQRLRQMGKIDGIDRGYELIVSDGETLRSVSTLRDSIEKDGAFHLRTHTNKYADQWSYEVVIPPYDKSVRLFKSDEEKLKNAEDGLDLEMARSVIISDVTDARIWGIDTDRFNDAITHTYREEPYYW